MKILNHQQDFELHKLNRFLYKYFFFFSLIKFIFFFFPSENFYIFANSISVIFFIIIFLNISKVHFFCYFAQISAIFLILLTQISFVISYVLSKISYNIDFENFINIFFFCDLKNYALANIYLSFFSISLVFFNKIIPLEIFQKVKKKINDYNFDFKSKRLYILITVCIFIELIYLFTGKLGNQMTGGFIVKDAELISGLNEYDDVTWYTQFYYFIITFHLFLNVIFFSQNKTKPSKLFFYFILLSIIINFLFYGFFLRRMAIQFFFIGTIFFIYFNKNKITFRTKIFGILIFFLIFQFTNFLQTIRTTESYNLNENKSLFEILKEGKVQEYFENESNLNRNEITSNISRRIFNNHELASLFYYRSGETNILKGQLLLNHFIRAIPSIIFPNKHNYPIAEPLISSSVPGTLNIASFNCAVPEIISPRPNISLSN